MQRCKMSNVPTVNLFHVVLVQIMQWSTTEMCFSKQLKGSLLVESLDYERSQHCDPSVRAQLSCHPEDNRQSTLSAKRWVRDRHSAIGAQPQVLNPRYSTRHGLIMPHSSCKRSFAHICYDKYVMKFGQAAVSLQRQLCRQPAHVMHAHLAVCSRGC